MASILALPGYVNLVSMKSGEIVLTFGEQRYRRDEIVPGKLHTAMAGPRLQATAGRYVEHCMIQQFGASRTGWPPLAREFLSESEPSMTPKQARRSREGQGREETGES